MPESVTGVVFVDRSAAERQPAHGDRREDHVDGRIRVRRSTRRRRMACSWSRRRAAVVGGGALGFEKSVAVTVMSAGSPPARSEAKVCEVENVVAPGGQV